MRRERTRWDEDNEAPFNVWAFLTVAIVVLGLAGLVVAVSLS